MRNSMLYHESCDPRETNFRSGRVVWLWALPCTGLLAVMLCGCAGFGQRAKADKIASNSGSPIQHHFDERLEHDDASIARLANSAENGQPGALALASGHPLANSVTTASYGAPVYADAPAGCSQCGSQAMPNSVGTCGCGQDNGCAPLPGPRRDVQEYIFDGGDNHAAVVVREDWSAIGLDPTDTVAYYETEGGQICVKPSNRVPIYAPRFGAVRQVRGLQLSELAIGTDRILAPVGAQRLEDAELAGNMVLPVAPHGEEQVRLLDALQENSGGVPIDQVVGWKGMSEARVPHQHIDLYKLEMLQDEELALLEQSLVGARTWYTPESLGVVIEGKSAVVLKDMKFAKEVFVYETEDKCSLRICKAASHTIADSGDTVQFTIRFDNVGPKPIRKAVILDSLSPRLEYIVGSEQASIPAKFESTPNDVGSSILRWEVEGEIAPSTGGVISFDCRVR